MQEWGYPLLDKLRMVWRYGLGSLLKLDYFIDNLLNHFGQIYPKLDAGQGFRSVRDLLVAMSPVGRDGAASSEMTDLASQTLSHKLAALGVANRLVEEIVTVASRVNYGQMPASLHAFVGSVGLAGMGGSLFAVQGGNKKVVECGLAQSGARVVRSLVEEVRQTETGSYSLQYSVGNQTQESQFEAVVIATPLTTDQVSLEVAGTFPGRYHTTVATIVRADPKPEAFGFKDPATFTSTNFFLSPNSVIVSVSKLSPVDYNPSKDDAIPPVFKIFSTRVLSTTELSNMFAGIEFVHSVSWLAYPSYTTQDDLSNFELSPGLFYSNRIEWAASAMEMSALSARNVANLVAAYLAPKQSQGRRTDV